MKSTSLCTVWPYNLDSKKGIQNKKILEVNKLSNCQIFRKSTDYPTRQTCFGSENKLFERIRKKKIIISFFSRDCYVNMKSCFTALRCWIRGSKKILIIKL